MLADMARSQSRQSSAVENCTTPLQTPSTATTWKAFFLEAETRENFQERFHKTRASPLRDDLGSFFMEIGVLPPPSPPHNIGWLRRRGEAARGGGGPYQVGLPRLL